MSAESGFSLAQVAIAVAILGILGAMATAQWTRYGRKQALIGECRSILAFLHEARAYGAKKSLPVGVAFDRRDNVLRLFEDRNANGALDAGEAVRTFALTHGLRVGLPPDGPAAGPWGRAVPASGLEGAWARAWTASDDPSAAPIAGSLFLYQNRLDRFTVCIAETAASRVNTAFLWSGTAWIGL
jgi:hypothetical protein